MPRQLPEHIRAVAGTSTEAVRNHVLDAAYRVIERGGLSAASTRAVADEAGVAAGTLYNYFDSQAALLAKAIANRAAAIMAPVGRIADRAGQGTVVGNLRRFVRDASAVLDELVPVTAAAFADPELLRALRVELGGEELIDPLGALERYLRAERKLGRVAAEADCRAAAAIVVSVCHDRAFNQFLHGHAGRVSNLYPEIELLARSLRPDPLQTI